jgi:endonuclease/exonuclease/phosphatase family metal-dependent hydrolase
MRASRLTFAALLVGLLAVPAVVASTTAAQAATQQITVLTWNMAGATSNSDAGKPDNEGRLKPVGALFRAIQDLHPQVVSVNEMCHSQYTHLMKDLSDAGITMHPNFNPTSVPGLNCNGLAYADWFAGNLILTTAQASDEKDYYFDGGALVDYQTSRGGACLTGQFAYRVRLCSFHLDQDQSGAVAQATTFANTFAAEFAQYPHLLLGDFNAPPAALLPVLYGPEAGGQGRFLEADMGAPGLGRITEGGRKIDYVFASRYHFDPAQLSAQTRDGGTCYTPHPCSDHQMLVGHLVLTNGGTTG